MSENQSEIKTYCPVSTTLALIGGKYKTLILWKLLDGTMRYSELRRVVPEATPKMFTRQLRDLEKDGLLTRTVYPVIPPRVEYALTEEGESIRPILAAMYHWGTQYLEKRHLDVECAMTPPEKVSRCNCICNCNCGCLDDIEDE